MKDRLNLEYADLLVVQKANLLNWKLRLIPKIFDAVEEYVLRCNLPAGIEGKHRVYRGQDLIEVIRQWPNLDISFEPVNPPAPVSDNPSDLI